MPEYPYATDPVFQMHRGGKIEVKPSVSVSGPGDLSMAYTPGVARVCTAIADQPELAHTYTWVANTVAVVSDGTAVLGLGDIGPAAAMPVMEGKALLFKNFGGVDAVLETARGYADDGDLRFAAELLKHAVFADPDHPAAKTALADVYQRLGFGAENPTWRNFYRPDRRDVWSGFRTCALP